MYHNRLYARQGLSIVCACAEPISGQLLVCIVTSLHTVLSTMDHSREAAESHWFVAKAIRNFYAVIVSLRWEYKTKLHGCSWQSIGGIVNIYDHLQITCGRLWRHKAQNIAYCEGNFSKWLFDNPFNKNVDPTFSLQSITEMELLNFGFHDLLFWRVWLTKSVLLNFIHSGSI